jgi:L-idonate 5-dehydrogenase
VDEVASSVPGPGQVAVDVAFGGICGSDLHYYHDGRVGDFRVVEPMILGHEVAGRVAVGGDGTDAPPPGTPVAIHPATPCDECRECRAGHRNVCAATRYLGSAARVPHVQGGFAQRIVVPAGQVRPLPSGLPLRLAALTEPLSVALHAVHRAGEVRGSRVLVTGAGPIGCLVVAALRHAGAAEVIAVDLVDEALALAVRVGATSAVRAGKRPRITISGRHSGSKIEASKRNPVATMTRSYGMSLVTSSAREKLTVTRYDESARRSMPRMFPSRIAFCDLSW